MCLNANRGIQIPSRNKARIKPMIAINWSLHDPCSYKDPFAKKSRRYKKSKKQDIVGDGDVWIENIANNARSNRVYSIFISSETGKRIPFEPPTGASKVIFLQDDVIEDLRVNRKYQSCRLKHC